MTTTTAPYPPSDYIIGLTWDAQVSRTGLGPIVNKQTQRRDGSDNWPITWAADGSLYTTYGDGYGFEPYLSEKLGLGFARIDGGPTDFNPVNIRSASGENKGFGRRGQKGSGLLMVDGTLYLWLFHADQQGGQAQLATSTDGAQSWTFSPWKFAEFGLCTFINFGPNYAGGRDDYVYTVSHDGPMADGPADRMVLMRAPKERIVDRSAYEFFVGTNDAGEPLWDADIQQRGPVFEHKDACLRSGISYSAPLKRYLWWQHIPQPPGHKDRGDTRFDGGFGIYEAPEPWGPWKTIYFSRAWDVGPGERAEFPPKWMSDDGRTLHLIFSGDDNFCVRRARLNLAD
ncbi:MAG: hypothetical protein GKR89_01060 [Candidatus Latescibacteria bacterium]|nr:hypothetical protein [Candidatus Latescibacterota bacterium]